MIKSYFVMLQDLLKKEFNFQFIEISSGEYALYNKIYPFLKDFVYKSLPNLINSEFEDSISNYDKEFFLNHLFDFFSQFFQRENQTKYKESDNVSLINDKY